MTSKKLLIMLALSACVTPHDPSMPAIMANDLTIMTSSCEAMPGRGADICRVTEGAPISSSWKIVLPSDSRLNGGEINVYYKDITRSYPINDVVTHIAWRDLIGHDVWEASDSSQALALASIRYKDNEGIETVVRGKGLAIIQVLKQGYSVMPLDSGFEAFQTRCDISYSTAGRSALSCR